MNKEKKARIKLYSGLETYADEIPCLTEDANLFDPEQFGSAWSQEYRDAAALAKALCSECPVRAECFDYGKKSYATAMVWGGYTYTEIERMRRGR